MSATPPQDTRAGQTGSEAHGPPPQQEGAVPQEGERSVAPIRWPRPDKPTLAGVLVWLVGLLVAVGLPAVVVPPGDESASGTEIALAFGLTVLGAVVMLAAAAFLAKRSKDAAVLTLGVVPAIAVIVLGIILGTTKLAAPG